MAVAWRTIEELARSQLPGVLSEVLGARRVRLVRSKSEAFDFMVTADGASLLVDVLAAPSPAILLQRWEQLRSLASRREIPVLVVRHMTASGRAFSSSHGVNWVDLSGNASIRAPQLQVRVEGRADQFRKRGRPASVFERRSSRLTRLLLRFPEREWTLRECAKEAGLDEGHASRIVSRLVEDALLTKEGRRLRVPDPQLLLDTWRDASDFSKHHVVHGHVPARSGEELVRQLSTRLTSAKLEHAVTGLGAAWLYDHFAMFRLATIYLHSWPTPVQLEQLHFREESTGSNVWLVLPADDGVFDGATLVDGVRCVHPVQAYVDLKDQPERSAEAANHLKEHTLRWRGAHGP